MNNAVYYEYVDSLVNAWLVESGALAVPDGPVICVVASSGCTYRASLGFPEPVEAGLRADRIGQTSITYGIGLFAPTADLAAAEAHFTHVAVNRETGRPVPLPDSLRRAVAAL